MKKQVSVTDAVGNVWTVPVTVIARSRAEAYKDEFGGDLQRIERGVAEIGGRQDELRFEHGSASRTILVTARQRASNIWCRCGDDLI